VPTRIRDDDKPVVEFDPTLEVSPFALFRRLSEGRAPLLVDVRSAGGKRSLAGAVAWPGAEWEPPAEAEVVLFDDHGREAVDTARALKERGFSRVRALFGGLDLYEFSLDPQVVGEQTFLITEV
jgi:rhodanese-related sulfurtransferase